MEANIFDIRKWYDELDSILNDLKSNVHVAHCEEKRIRNLLLEMKEFT